MLQAGFKRGDKLQYSILTQGYSQPELWLKQLCSGAAGAAEHSKY
jgi:hypothetical protein